MKNYILKCRKCHQEIDLGGKIKELNIQCPNCGKNIVVPPHMQAKSKKGLITFILILAVLLGGGAYLFKMYEDQVAAERLAEKQARMRKEAEQKRVEESRAQAEKERIALKLKIIDLCDEANLKTDKDFQNAFAAVRKYKNLCTDAAERENADKYKELLSKAKDAALNRVYESLENKTAPLAQEGKLTQCALIYKNYNGPFAKDTYSKRMEIADKYRREAMELKSAEQAKQNEIAKAEQKMLADVSKLLVNRKFKLAYDEFQKFPYKEEAPGLSKVFDDLLHIPSIVMDSFNDEKGKTVKVYLKSGPLDLEIVKAEGSTLTAKYKAEKIQMVKKIKFSDLSPQEISKRVARKNKELANLYYGINLLTLRNFDDAEKHFQNAGVLAKPLAKELQTLRAQRVTKSTAKDPAGASAPVNPNAVPLEKIKIESAKVYIGTRKKEVTTWGSNQRIQNILINLRNGTGMPVSTGRIDFYVIGEGVLHKDTYQIIYTVSKPLKMQRSGTMCIKDEFMNQYDDAGIKYGHKCYSWLLVIRDKDGNVKLVKAKHSKFEHAADKILEIAKKSGNNAKHAPQFNATGKIVKVNPGTPY